MSPSGSFIAYNDLVPSTATPSTNCFWNSFTHGRGARGPASGELLATDRSRTGVTLAFHEHVTDPVHSINSAKDVGTVRPCTPAFKAFGSCMCPSPVGCDSTNCDDECDCDAFHGELSYNDKPGWFFRYLLRGLNPACSANLTLYVHRGQHNRGDGEDLEDYGSRYTLFTLEGTDVFQGDVKSALDSFDHGRTLVLRGGRNFDGHIARWTSIKSNGTFSVVASHDRNNRLIGRVQPPPHPYKAYSGGLLKLEQHCPVSIPTKLVDVHDIHSYFIWGLMSMFGILFFTVLLCVFCSRRPKYERFRPTEMYNVAGDRIGAGSEGL